MNYKIEIESNGHTSYLYVTAKTVTQLAADIIIIGELWSKAAVFRTKFRKEKSKQLRRQII